jgi:hypothetical protein
MRSLRIMVDLPLPDGPVQGSLAVVVILGTGRWRRTQEKDFGCASEGRGVCVVCRFEGSEQVGFILFYRVAFLGGADAETHRVIKKDNEVLNDW